MGNHTALENNEVGNVWTSEIYPRYTEWKKIKLKNNEYNFDSYIKATVILMIGMLILMKTTIVICIKLKWFFPISEIFLGFCFQVIVM